MRTRNQVELAGLRTMREEIERRSFGFNRRPGARNNRGRIAVGSVAPFVLPSTLATVAAAQGFPGSWGFRADLVTIETGISLAYDTTGNGRHITQTSAASQPLQIASDPLFNNQPSIQFDGVDDFLSNTFSRVAPGTTPFWGYLIVRADAWAANNTIWSDGGHTLYQNSAGNGVRIFGSVNGPQNNNLPTAGAAKRIVFNCLNTTSDYIWIGPTPVSNGTNTGNVASGANSYIGCAPPGLRFWPGRAAEGLFGLGTISGPAVTALDAAAVTRYGAVTT